MPKKPTPHKKAKRAAKPRPPQLGKGATVVASDLPHTDPHTELVVTAVHRDGTVDLSELGDSGGYEWVHVDPAVLLEVNV